MEIVPSSCRTNSCPEKSAHHSVDAWPLWRLWHAYESFQSFAVWWVPQGNEFPLAHVWQLQKWAYKYRYDHIYAIKRLVENLKGFFYLGAWKLSVWRRWWWNINQQQIQRDNGESLLFIVCSSCFASCKCGRRKEEDGSHGSQHPSNPECRLPLLNQPLSSKDDAWWASPLLLNTQGTVWQTWKG